MGGIDLFSVCIHVYIVDHKSSIWVAYHFWTRNRQILNFENFRLQMPNPTLDGKEPNMCTE